MRPSYDPLARFGVLALLCVAGCAAPDDEPAPTASPGGTGRELPVEIAAAVILGVDGVCPETKVPTTMCGFAARPGTAPVWLGPGWPSLVSDDHRFVVLSHDLGSELVGGGARSLLPGRPLRFSADGRVLVVRGEDDRLQAVDTASRDVTVLSEATAELQEVDVSPDGQWVAGLAFRVWTSPTGGLLPDSPPSVVLFERVDGTDRLEVPLVDEDGRPVIVPWFRGWAADSARVLLRTSRAFLVALDGSVMRIPHGFDTVLSPASPELAYVEDGPTLLDLTTMASRSLGDVGDRPTVGPWSPDAALLRVTSAEGQRILRAGDGEVVFRGNGRLHLGPDGWFWYEGGFRHASAPEVSTLALETAAFEWLEGGAVAFQRERSVVVAQLDGSDVQEVFRKPREEAAFLLVPPPTPLSARRP